MRQGNGYIPVSETNFVKNSYQFFFEKYFYIMLEWFKDIQVFFQLDDTVRLKNPNSSRSGERSRLIREDDENDMSDDDNLEGK